MTSLKWKDSADDLLQEKIKTHVTMLIMIRTVQNHKSLTSAIWNTGQFSSCPTQHSICMLLLTNRRKKYLILYSQRTQCLYYSSNNESTWRRSSVWKMKLWNQKTCNKSRHTTVVIIMNNLISRGNIHSKFCITLTDQYKLCQRTEETNMGNSNRTEKPYRERNS